MSDRGRKSEFSVPEAQGPDTQEPVGRRQLMRLLTGTAIGAGAVAGLTATARPAGAQTAPSTAYLNQAQTFTAAQTFSAQTNHSQVAVTAPAAGSVPLTVRLASGQSADAFQVRDHSGAVVTSLSMRGDLKVNRLIARTPPWTGVFLPPITFDSEPSMGWMPHPAGINSFSYVQGGREGFRISADGQNSQITGMGVNRMMLFSASAMVMAAGSGHFELEGPAASDLEVFGYQIGSPLGKTIVFVAEPQFPAVPVAVRGSGNVNLQEWRDKNGVTGMAVDQHRRLKFFGEAQTGTASSGAANLPNKPVGFFSVTDSAGIERKIAYYAV